MTKSPEIAVRNYVRKSLMAFLEGEQSLNWIVGVIRSSGMRGFPLQQILNRYEQYGDPERFYLTVETCRENGWLE
jgi:hypothetical protein